MLFFIHMSYRKSVSWKTYGFLLPKTWQNVVKHLPVSACPLTHPRTSLRSSRVLAGSSELPLTWCHDGAITLSLHLSTDESMNEHKIIPTKYVEKKSDAQPLYKSYTNWYDINAYKFKCYKITINYVTWHQITARTCWSKLSKLWRSVRPDWGAGIRLTCCQSWVPRDVSEWCQCVQCIRVLHASPLECLKHHKIIMDLINHRES